MSSGKRSGKGATRSLTACHSRRSSTTIYSASTGASPGPSRSPRPEFRSAPGPCRPTLFCLFLRCLYKSLFAWVHFFAVCLFARVQQCTALSAKHTQRATSERTRKSRRRGISSMLINASWSNVGICRISIRHAFFWLRHETETRAPMCAPLPASPSAAP